MMKISKQQGYRSKSFLFIALVILYLFLFICRSFAQDHTAAFMASDKRTLRRCKGSALAIFHKPEMKEYMRLMNLARTDPDLLKHYITQRYGQAYTDAMPWKQLETAYAINRKRNASLLRPSFGLHLGSVYHAIWCGMNNRTGHQYFQTRLVASFNFNILMNKVSAGENCQYGSTAGIDIFQWLVNSPGHRANMLSPYFMRVGISQKYHKGFGKNTVTLFSGPKLHDLLLHNHESHLATR
jgi:hypothetical protein